MAIGKISSPQTPRMGSIDLSEQSSSLASRGRRARVGWGRHFRVFLWCAVSCSSVFGDSESWAQRGRRPTAPPEVVASPPPPPAVPNEPLLAQIPRPRRTVSSWRDMVTLLQAKSPELAQALAGIEVAEGRSRAALALALPQVNAVGAARHELLVNVTSQVAENDSSGRPVFEPIELPYKNVLVGGVSGTQAVIAPKVWYGISVASDGAKQARSSLLETRRQVILKASSAALASFAAERAADIQRTALAAALERLDLSTRKLALGGGTLIDVARARYEVEISRSTMVTANEALRQSRESLGLVLGLAEAVGVDQGFRIQSIESTISAECREVGALEGRADVMAATYDLKRGSGRVTEAYLQMAPSLAFQSDLATTSANTGAAPRTTWNIQAVLTIPIWDGGTAYGNARIARGDATAAGARLDTTQRNATIEVAQAKRGVEVTETNRIFAKNARDIAADTEVLVRRAYAEGKGTWLDLSFSAAALRTAEISLALRELEAVKARVAARLALAVCDTF